MISFRMFKLTFDGLKQAWCTAHINVVNTVNKLQPSPKAIASLATNPLAAADATQV